MERFTAEVWTAQREDSIKRAIKAKMSFPDIAAEFDLSEAELTAFIKKHQLDGGPPRRPTDIKDARDEPSGSEVRRGRR